MKQSNKPLPGWFLWAQLPSGGAMNIFVWTRFPFLKYLTGIGYLFYGTDTKMYRGTLKLAGLGAEVMSNFDLRQQVHPQLIKLHQETEHTCNMGIKSGHAGIFVDKIESRDFGIKLFSEIGKKLSAALYGDG